MPITDGSTPALDQDTILAIGSRFLFFISSEDITAKAAAPSFIPLAFAAVTVPSFANAGLKDEIFSN